MIGYPGETYEDVNRTLDMLHTLDPEVTLLSVAHPMKGTKFYDDVADASSGRPDGRSRTAGDSRSRCRIRASSTTRHSA